MGKIKLLLGTSILLLSGQINAALLIVDENFELIGATGIYVDVFDNGRDKDGFYDVSFQDGTCAELFNGCDEPTDFTFQDRQSAENASLALLNQVFIGFTQNPFDFNTSASTSRATRGCALEIAEFFGAIYCIMLTPFWFDLDDTPVRRATQTFNIIYPDVPNEPFLKVDADEVVFFRDITNLNTTDYDYDTWAIWSKSSTIPTPAAIWLFGIGLIGLIGFSKPRKAA